ncbi:SAP domain-containing protein [Sporosarcina psychrophila]|uniref:SAP domain-containing protein n=1 Tax=Sporosarcina psychrophila TaxID=1476 RepID=A0ABV2K9Z1_SPOPS
MEILMLDYADGLTVEGATFPRYWHFQYNSDPKKLIKKLLSLKLLNIDTSILASMKIALVSDLKHLLRQRELKVSGSKNELIERLIENVPNDELQNIFNQQKYLLSDDGRKVLELNEHIKFFHSHGNLGVSIHHAHAVKKKRPELSKFDIAWQQLNLTSMNHAKNGDWGLYRNDRLGMSTVLILENKLSEALGLLFEVCYYDLSGLSNNFNLDFIGVIEDYFFPYEDSNHTLAPGIITKIQDIQDKLAISEKEFEEFYFNHIKRITTPIHLFTRREVMDILIHEMNANKDKVSKIYRKAQKRYKQEGVQSLLTIQSK